MQENVTLLDIFFTFVSMLRNAQLHAVMSAIAQYIRHRIMLALQYCNRRAC